MKKKLISIICCIAVVASLCICASADGTKIVKEVLLSDSDFKIDGQSLKNFDFSGYAANKTFYLDSGLQFVRNGGIVNAVETGKNESLQFGVGDTAGSGNAFVEIPLGSYHTSGKSDSVIIDFDIYFDGKSSVDTNSYGNESFYLQFYGSTSSARKRGMIWDEALYTKFGDGTGELAKNDPDKVNGVYDYAEKTWYKFRIELSWTPNGNNFDYTYNLHAPIKDGKLDASGEMTEIVTNEEAMHAASKMTFIRIYAPKINTDTNGEQKSVWAALDNVKIFRERGLPTVSGLSYGKSESSMVDCADGGTIKWDSTLLSVNMSDYLTTVGEGSVLLYRIDGEEKIPCSLLSLAYDEENERILLEPVDALTQKAQYEIVLTTDIETDSGINLPSEQLVSFYTDEEPVSRIYIEDKDFYYGEVPLTNEAATDNPTTLDSKLLVSKYSGYVNSEEIKAGDGRGNSLKLGIYETGANQPSLNIPVEDLITEGQKGSVRLDMDYYFNAKTDYSAAGGDSRNGTFRFAFYGIDNNPNIANWNKDMNATSAIGGSKAYEAEKWYKASLYLVWQPNGDKFDYTYDLYVGEYDENGECGEMELVVGNKELTGQAKLSQLRFYIPRVVESEKWVALDNILLEESKAIPDISGFGTNGTENGHVIDCEAEIVEIYLTEGITGANKNQVILKQNGITVPVSAVGYDAEKQAVLLKLSEKLKENADYTVELLPDIEVWDGTEMGRLRASGFTTTSIGTAVRDVETEQTDSGIIATAYAKNVSEETQKIYFIASIWKGNEFVGNKVQIISLSSGEEKNISMEIPISDEGLTVNILAWNKISGARMLANKIKTVSY